MGVCFFLRSQHKRQWNQAHKSTKSNEGRKKGRTERKGGEEERKKGGKAGQKEGRKIDWSVFLAPCGPEVFLYEYFSVNICTWNQLLGPLTAASDSTCGCSWTVCWKVGFHVSPIGFLLSFYLRLPCFQPGRLLHQLLCWQSFPVLVQTSNSKLSLAISPSPLPHTLFVDGQVDWLIQN